MEKQIRELKSHAHRNYISNSRFLLLLSGILLLVALVVSLYLWSQISSKDVTTDQDKNKIKVERQVAKQPEHDLRQKLSNARIGNPLSIEVAKAENASLTVVSSDSTSKTVQHGSKKAQKNRSNKANLTLLAHLVR
jgi:hypothetical protein